MLSLPFTLPAALATAGVAMTAGLSILWAARWRHRAAPDYESLLAQLDKPFKSYLHIPDSSFDIQLHRELDEALWKNIQGFRGLRRLFRNAGVMLSLRLRLEQDISGEVDAIRMRNQDDIALLRLMLFCAICEHYMIKRFPKLPIQRVFLRSAVNQYLEIRSYLRAAIEYSKPSLVQRFDAVV